MKPDWDKLMGEFEGSTTSLVADVDCTAGGKALCEKVGVEGYPTIKYGDPNDLKDYSGGRSFSDLKKFAEENLGPTCGPDNLDLCNEEDKALIEGFLKMETAELTKLIEEGEAAVDKIVTASNKKLDGLQKKIADIQKQITAENAKKDKAVSDADKKIGLKFKKKVAAQKKKDEM
mmetsp:Transcript_122511/g.225798  ORF Transcript_122511/g.225798 Transcript_122511/m.225798 type:complete len:175 (-) Transcript_122511:103-627(-)